MDPEDCEHKYRNNMTYRSVRQSSAQFVGSIRKVRFWLYLPQLSFEIDSFEAF